MPPILEGRRNQEDITHLWIASDCLVSIICPTYNHENYIRTALEGFLAQVTSFRFEIIVHDDASTDGTVSIVQDYAAQYPDIIKPIYQKENQYSKGGFKPAIYAAQFCSGHYMAICEGDDYWIDENKLQRQVESMQQNSEVDFSFHAAYMLTEQPYSLEVSWLLGESRIIGLDVLLNSRLGSFAPTSSYVFRKRVFDNLPTWFVSAAPVADFFLERYGALRGGALYINEPMSVYRNLALGSWTVAVRDDDVAYRRYIKGMCRSLELMESDFHRYSISFDKFCARFYLKHAVEALIRGDTQRFDDLVLKSVGEWKYVSKKQFLCYQLRALPTVLRRIISARREAKS